MKPIYRSLILTTTLITAACGGSQGSNSDGTPSSVNLDFLLVSTASKTLAKAIGDFNISSATASIERVELYLPKNTSCSDVGLTAHSDDRSSHTKNGADDPADHDANDDNGGNDNSQVKCEDEREMEHGSSQLESKIKINGPWLFDLITGVSTPDMGKIKIPSGTHYRRIKIRFDDSDALQDNSFVAAGTVLDANNVSRDFELALDFGAEVEVGNDQGISICADTLNNLTVGLDVEAWLNNVNLADCTVNANNLIRIDDDHSGESCDSNVEEQVRDNIENSVLMFGSCAMGGGDTTAGDDAGNDDGTPDQGSGDL